ncbi:MAG: Ppx/GppA family phosphatase [Alphaproteobacteria bacterium]|nr:Ppx/GppA family phosphatase [Alphaproteobacteria bacterium]
MRHQSTRGAGRGGAQGGAYGAVDLGTNNCRLLIAHPTQVGFRVVDAFSRIVRLGEGVAASGRLSEAAIERTMAALRICADKIRWRNVRYVRAVATEACRRASNVDAFVDRVNAEIGIALEVISPREEVDLALLGCYPLIDPQTRYAIVFDIGGGSTELSWVHVAAEGLDLIGWTSLPWGVVNLAEEHGGDRVDDATFEAIVVRIDAALAAFDEDNDIGKAVAEGHVQMIGTSGTVTTLAGLHLDLPSYDRRRVDGISMQFENLSDVTARLRSMDYGERAALPCIGKDRADLVVVGCAVLEAILRRWPIGRLRIADRGLREGILLRLMAANGTASPHPS